MSRWFVDEYGITPLAIIVVAVVLIGSAIGALAACGVFNGPDCPKGQRVVVEYYMPQVIMVGKVPVTEMLPVYGCAAS